MVGRWQTVGSSPGGAVCQPTGRSLPCVASRNLPSLDPMLQLQQHLVLDAISAWIRVGVERCELRVGLHAALFCILEASQSKCPFAFRVLKGNLLRVTVGRRMVRILGGSGSLLILPSRIPLHALFASCRGAVGTRWAACHVAYGASARKSVEIGSADW